MTEPVTWPPRLGSRRVWKEGHVTRSAGVRCRNRLLGGEAPRLGLEAVTRDISPEIPDRRIRAGDLVEELRVLCPGGRRADHVTGHAEELLTSMCKICLLRYVLFNRREERIGVALRAGRVVIRWNEELVSVVIIAVRVMTGRAGQ